MASQWVRDPIRGAARPETYRRPDRSGPLEGIAEDVLGQSAQDVRTGSVRLGTVDREKMSRSHTIRKWAVTVVPASDVDWIWNLPRQISTRSRMLRNP